LNTKYENIGQADLTKNQILGMTLTLYMPILPLTQGIFLLFEHSFRSQVHSTAK